MGGRLRDDRSNGSGWTGPAVEFRPHGLKEKKCTSEFFTIPQIYTYTVVHVQLFSNNYRERHNYSYNFLQQRKTDRVHSKSMFYCLLTRDLPEVGWGEMQVQMEEGLW